MYRNVHRAHCRPAVITGKTAKDINRLSISMTWTNTVNTGGTRSDRGQRKSGWLLGSMPPRNHGKLAAQRWWWWPQNELQHTYPNFFMTHWISCLIDFVFSVYVSIISRQFPMPLACTCTIDPLSAVFVWTYNNKTLFQTFNHCSHTKV